MDFGVARRPRPALVRRVNQIAPLLNSRAQFRDSSAPGARWGWPARVLRTGRVAQRQGSRAIRDQFISNLVLAGVHPKVAQQLARQTITLTMDRYAHVPTANAVSALERLAAPG